MAKTLVGVFDDVASAQNAVRELRGLGIRDSHVRLMHNSDATGAADTTGKSDGSWMEKVSSWFQSLFDDESDREHASHYAEAWRRGHYIVVADVESNTAENACAIMNRYGTVDLGQRTEHWQRTGYSGQIDTAAAPYTAEQRQRELAAYRQRAPNQQQTTAGNAIPVVQEELAIGKRVVQRGGVRVHSYVEERPVEEVVRLREEQIDVQRRPVNRPAAAGDLAFQERTIDITATGEEALVEKRARVVEEVVVGKSVTEREQRVQETVRRKDVKVERVTDSKPAHGVPRGR